MADIEKVIAELKEYHDRDWTEERDFPATRETRKRVTGNALELLKSKQKEIERLCNKIGVMKESIEDAIMSETVFDTFDDLSSYVNAERCRSEEWTGGIRDAIQAVRAWGE